MLWPPRVRLIIMNEDASTSPLQLTTPHDYAYHSRWLTYSHGALYLPWWFMFPHEGLHPNLGAHALPWWVIYPRKVTPGDSYTYPMVADALPWLTQTLL